MTYLTAGDILAVKYVNGNAGYLSIYGSTTNGDVQTNMNGYKIGKYFIKILY